MWQRLGGDMVEITGSGDCGNSPKNQFAQDVAVALETGRIAPGMLSEAVSWSGPGEVRAEGIEAVRQALQERPEVSAIVIEHAISHGRVGMANGVTVLRDGRRRRFSHVFEFTSTKAACVAAISSYG